LYTDTPAPTAALLLIGNELLSGRTQDKNLAFIGSRLAARGIVLSEARVIADIPAVIVQAVNELRARYTYVFTTGGIGPTHDDITADCVADAMGVQLEVHPEAEARLLAYFKSRDVEANADRMRMARVPAGGTLIDNPVSIAPGFQIENVYVMAGVPRIMQSMFESIEPGLAIGPRIDSVSVICNLAEGTIASALRQLQEEFSTLDLGSYPMSAENGLRVALVAKGSDHEALADVEVRLKAMVQSLNGEVFDA
jgi:molybdenum cofactor synthesis domain-containing protein